MRSFFATVALSLFLSVFSSGSWAQTPPAPAPASVPAPTLGGGFFQNLGGAASNIKSKADGSIAASLFDAGLGYGRKTVTWALAIAGSLATIYLIIECIGVMSGKNSSMLVVIFDVGLPVVFCAYLLLNYESIIVSFAGKGGLLDYIRNVGGDATLTIMDMYSSILKLVSTAISDSWSGVGDVFKKGPGIFTNIAFAVVDVIGTMLFALVIIMLSFTGLAELLGLVMMGPFLCAVAVAFGPIFIAGLVSPWTREYFSKWLGFLVASAVLTGVVSVCVAIATTLFQTFNFAAIAGDTTTSATALLIAAVILMSINSLIQQAPGIANAMVPGSFGASKGSGNAVREGANAAGGKAKAIGQSAKDIRSKAKDKMKPEGGPTPSPTANASPMDIMNAAKGASKYPTLGL